MSNKIQNSLDIIPYTITLIDASLGPPNRPWIEKAKGHWGHRGRKGKRGGSAPSKGGLRVKLNLLYDMEKKSPKATEGLKEMVGNLPLKHQEIVSKWDFVGMAASKDEEKDTAEGQFLPLYVNPQDQTVNIMRGELVRRNPALYHELGHLVYDTEKNKSLKGWTPPMAKEMKALGRRHGDISQSRMKAELFSDAYELYFSNRSEFESGFPTSYAFFSKAMKEAE